MSSTTFPLISVIIPTRPGQKEILAVEAAHRLDYPADKLEIIIARGRQPAVQRNHALRVAKGEWVYFLDDDSQPAEDNLQRALDCLKEPSVKIVGGPNLCPVDAPPLERVFAVCLASFIAFGPSRARYEKVGARRVSSEKELILCNMMAHRRTLLDLGGFNEALYPNEENALMDELQKRGSSLIYDPGFYVFRRPRPSIKAFCKMLMNYGRGRAEQFRLHPTPGSALNFVPPLFLAYLFFLMGISVTLPAWTVLLSVPLIPYVLALLGQTLLNFRPYGLVRSIAAIPLLFLTHTLYGAGFWKGLFTRLTPARTEVIGPVELEVITPRPNVT